MNAMTSALAAAGVKLPSQMERVWRMLKDNPNRTAKAVAAQTGIPLTSVSSICSKMELRGMMRHTERQEVSRGKNGLSYGRTVYYFTPIGDEFELLPMPPKPKKDPVTPSAARLFSQMRAEVDAMPVAAPIPAPVPRPAPKYDVESMTISEARTMWNHLNQFFGGPF